MLGHEDNLLPARAVRWIPLDFLLTLGVVGGVALWRPAALVIVAVPLCLLVLAHVAFDRAARWGALSGLALPLLMGGLGLAGRAGVPAAWLAGLAWGLGIAGALALRAAPALARRVHAAWVRTAGPVGFVINHLLLGTVFFLVVVPTGLLLRLFGYDPMDRSREPETESYWVPDTYEHATTRYFKQY